FTLSWLGVGPLYQLAEKRLAWNDSGLLLRTDAVTGALALTLLATLVVSAAIWATSRTTRSTAVARDGGVVPRRWAPWGFLGVLAVLTPYVMVTNGGIASLFASREDRTSDLTSAGVSLEQSGGLQVAVAVILPAALAVAATHLFLLQIRIGRREGGV